jgi:hypothetical protein
LQIIQRAAECLQAEEGWGTPLTQEQAHITSIIKKFMDADRLEAEAEAGWGPSSSHHIMATNVTI